MPTISIPAWLFRFPATLARLRWRRSLVFAFLLGGSLFFNHLGQAATGPAIVYIRDTTNDTGIEPDPDPGIMYASPDIWVRQTPIPGHTPYPFSVDPAWLTAISPLDQDPVYRDPKYSKPNYVYVRVRNVGGTASTGTEQLHVYWAKASTGLSWPSQWVDYLDTTCGPTNLYGIELTKPRRNAADPGVPQADVDEYKNAILAIGKSPVPAAYKFPDMSFFSKQQQVHNYIAVFPDSGGFNPHGSDAFLPWHREFINRYEILLRQAYPKVTLFYWDWTTDPSTYARFTGLMGNFHNYPTYAIGAPFQVAGFVPPQAGGTLTRDTGTLPAMTPDSTIVGKGTFSNHRKWNEGEGGIGNNAHDQAHPFIGGSGNMSDPSIAAEDPFFFMLHGNVDRLWAMWQRVLGDTSRYDPATAYTGAGVNMTLAMAPWNGFNNNGTGGGIGTIANVVRPWTTTDGYITDKPANDPSVVFPPIYDTAPLTIPVLAAGQSVVIEIPWYPPNPATYSCFGGDEGHVCLLARIETSTNAPYGMTFPEGTDVNANTRNNNKIAWKNVSVEQSFIGPIWLSPIWLRDLAPIQNQVQLHATLQDGLALFNYGKVYVDLGPTLFSRWAQNGGVAQGFVPAGGTLLQLTASNGIISNLTLSSNEAQQVAAELVLANGYNDPQGHVFNLNIEQYGGSSVAGASNQFVGGQQIQFDFNQLTPVPPNGTWHYLATGQYPGSAWTQPGYDDSQWPTGTAKLGFGNGDENTIIDGGPQGAPNITTWFRYDFTLTDPGLYRNLWLKLLAQHGAVAYLNGVEIDRLRMPNGVIAPNTPATANVSGLAGELFYPANVSQFLGLLQTSNVLAVEVHQPSPPGTNLAFDAELNGNLAAPTFPPMVSFLSPPDGSLFLSGQQIIVTTAALSPTGAVVSVGYYADGQFLGAVSQPPYTFVWANAPLGTHQFTAVASNSFGLTGYAFRSVQVLSNLPPAVVVTSPTANSVYLPTDQIPFNVSASEIGGTISQVDFYLMRHGTIFQGPQLIGSATAPPYSMQLSGLASGGYFLSASATDTIGASGDSSPVFIEVATVPPPVLTLSNAPPYIILNWTPNTALLQQSPAVTGPWQTVSNATTPYQVLPTGPRMFFRAQAP
jgi:Common central domain of tyrosinase/Bacterial Ig domain